MLIYFSISLLILYVVVLILVFTGCVQLLRCFNTNSQLELIRMVNDDDLDSVTILRPIRGIDSEMDWCLESSFRQEYPIEKLQILFCVQSGTDPAIPIIQDLIARYPKIDTKLIIDENQNNLDCFGPNPKVNNLHKGYKNAKHDLLWVMDSNVYANPLTLKRSVYTLRNDMNNGSRIPTLLGGRRKVKLVTHVPIVVSKSTHSVNWGAKLDEIFMSTSHAKFYVALNRIQPAPCVNGKSNLYRRSDLDTAVANITQTEVRPGDGFKHFAKYIGEDNMIGIALWDGVDGCAGMSKDFVIQPINGQNSVKDYVDRRVRWLRVRKYMVLAATLLEPTTESLLSGIIGSFAINVIMRNKTQILWKWFFIHMLIWFMVDLLQYQRICTTVDENSGQKARMFQLRKFIQFWLLREVLAFPIWLKAMCGSGIEWRGQQFKILPDLSAERL